MDLLIATRSAGKTREIGALFADAPDTTAELGGSGVYVGKARIAEYYDRVIGGEGLKQGQLFNHMILQGVVHVADDGRANGGVPCPGGPCSAVSRCGCRGSPFGDAGRDGHLLDPDDAREPVR